MLEMSFARGQESCVAEAGDQSASLTHTRRRSRGSGSFGSKDGLLRGGSKRSLHMRGGSGAKGSLGSLAIAATGAGEAKAKQLQEALQAAERELRARDEALAKAQQDLRTLANKAKVRDTGDWKTWGEEERGGTDAVCVCGGVVVAA